MATTVPERVFSSLCDDVFAGRYPPGERLPPQRALAAELGVNMGSVREGVKRLEQVGLVDVRHGDGMRVRDWRALAGLEVLALALFAGGRPDPALLADLMEARTLMLADAATLAAKRREPERAARLVDLAEAIAAARDRATVQALDFEYMSTLVEAAGNTVLRLVMNTIRTIYFDNADAFAGVVARVDELVPLYRGAARAVAAREASVAREALTRLAAAQAEGLLA